MAQNYLKIPIFRKAMRGYAPEQVDAYVAAVQEKFYTICSDNEKLRAKIAAMAAEEKKRGVEEELRRRELEELNERADGILDEAKKRADRLLYDAEREARRVRDEADAEARAKLRDAEERSATIVEEAKLYSEEAKTEATALLEDRDELVKRAQSAVAAIRKTLEIEHKKLLDVLEGLDADAIPAEPDEDVHDAYVTEEREENGPAPDESFVAAEEEPAEEEPAEEEAAPDEEGSEEETAEDEDLLTWQNPFAEGPEEEAEDGGVMTWEDPIYDGSEDEVGDDEIMTWEDPFADGAEEEVGDGDVLTWEDPFAGDAEEEADEEEIMTPEDPLSEDAEDAGDGDEETEEEYADEEPPEEENGERSDPGYQDFDIGEILKGLEYMTGDGAPTEAVSEPGQALPESDEDIVSALKEKFAGGEDETARDVQTASETDFYEDEEHEDGESFDPNSFLRFRK